MNNNSAFQIDGFIRLSLLTVAEVSRILNVSAGLVYRLIQSGDLPAIRFGRAIRVKPADLEQYLARKTSSGANSEEETT